MRAGQVGGARHEGGDPATYEGGGTAAHEGGDPAPYRRVDVADLVRTRTHHPEAIAEAAARRPRRPSSTAAAG